MSGFAATSGKYEVFAPGDDTHVMFNDNNDLNANSGLTFTKASATLKSTIFITDTDATNTSGATSAIFAGDGNDIGMFHDGTNSYVRNITGELNIVNASPGTDINIDADGDDVVIKYSGTTGATFNTSGLNLASGDSYSIGDTAVLSATGATLIQKTALTGLSELSSADSSADFLLISDTDDSSGTLKKISPDNLGITGGGGAGTDALQRALRTLGLVEVDAS